MGQLGLSWLELGEESACEGPGPTSRLPVCLVGPSLSACRGSCVG